MTNFYRKHLRARHVKILQQFFLEGQFIEANYSNFTNGFKTQWLLLSRIVLKEKLSWMWDLFALITPTCTVTFEVVAVALNCQRISPQKQYLHQRHFVSHMNIMAITKSSANPRTYKQRHKSALLKSLVMIGRDICCSYVRSCEISNPFNRAFISTF